MKIAIFGATGRTGIPLVQQALDRGHEVVALARTPTKMATVHERLTVVQGDIQDADRVEQTIAGTDAVLSVLGHTRSSADDTLSVAVRHIIAAMQKQNVQRLITLTGAGVRYPGKDEPALFDRVMGVALKLMAGKLLADSKQHVAQVQNSGLRWTVVRVPMLTEGAHTGQIKVGYVGRGIRARIGRADVADFMLRVLETDSHIHDMPAISN